MVVRLVEMLVFAVGIFGGGGAIAYAYLRKTRPTVPEVCKHKRWTKWKIIDTVEIHAYSEVDEGKGLPDRVDALMQRECAICGIRQDKTVRGIDSPHYK